MKLNFICKFSANDPDFPFTVGEIYEATSETKGFNHLSTHILCDNGLSVKVETINVTVEGKQRWLVKDFREYSARMNYAAFEIFTK